MEILSGNINLLSDELAIASRQLGDISALAKDGAVNIDRNSGLSQSARDEIDAQSVDEIIGLGEAKKQISIIEEIVKASVLLKKIVEPDEPNFGKFVEVGNETNIVIDPKQI